MALPPPSLPRRARASLLARLGCSGLLGVGVGAWLVWAHASFDPIHAGIAVALGVLVFATLTARSRDDF